MKVDIISSLFFQLLVVTSVLAFRNVVASDAETKESVTNVAAVVEACQEDYSPCTCNTNSNTAGQTTIDVTCSSVPTFEAVQAVFRRPNVIARSQITSFSLTIPYSETNNSVPSNLLGSTATRDIRLTCPTSTTQISVNPNAFTASKDYAQSLTFIGCDLGQLNYTFLKDLYATNELYYSNVVNLSTSLASLPSLPSISKVTVIESPDFEGINSFSVSNAPAWSELSIISCPKFQFLPTDLPPLTKLTISSCPLFKTWEKFSQLNRLSSITLTGYNEETINNALTVIASPPLVDTITELNLNENKLTQAPAQIRSFSQLQSVYLESNNILRAKYDSLTFTTSKLKLLKLSSNNLNFIESAAFQGDFKASQIYLDGNNLTRLESLVFKPILEQMEMADQNGYVDIWGNPIKCDCHLDWLFRDNSQLLDRVLGGKCSNGTDFSSLNAEHFANCKNGVIVTTTVKPPTTVSGATSILLFDRIFYLILILSTFICF